MSDFEEIKLNLVEATRRCDKAAGILIVCQMDHAEGTDFSKRISVAIDELEQAIADAKDAAFQAEVG